MDYRFMIMTAFALIATVPASAACWGDGIESDWDEVSIVNPGEMDSLIFSSEEAVLEEEDEFQETDPQTVPQEDTVEDETGKEISALLPVLRAENLIAYGDPALGNWEEDASGAFTFHWDENKLKKCFTLGVEYKDGTRDEISAEDPSLSLTLEESGGHLQGIMAYGGAIATLPLPIVTLGEKYPDCPLLTTDLEINYDPEVEGSGIFRYTPVGNEDFLFYTDQSDSLSLIVAILEGENIAQVFKGDSFTWDLETGKTYHLITLPESGEALTYYVLVGSVRHGIALPIVEKPKAISVAKGVKVSWKPVTDAKRYEVYRAEGADGDMEHLVLLTTTKKCTYVDPSVRSGEVYTYFVSPEDYSVGNDFYSSTDYSEGSTICYVSRMEAPHAKAKKRAVKLSWPKVAGADGYEIRYALDKSFSGAKLVLTKKPSKTLKNLTSGEKYFFCVRAYIKYQGRAHRGAWSKVSGVRVKG